MEQKTFLISDTHFSHSKVIDYENRPFKSTEEMDQYMIDRWNAVVGENDLVFHLGDVYIGSATKMDFLKKLNGRKILILGNHDSVTNTKWRKLGFEPFKHYIYKDYLLTHIPVDLEPLKVATAYNLLKGNIHGHTHSRNQHLDMNYFRSPCVELIAYQPIEFKEFINVWEELKCLQKNY